MLGRCAAGDDFILKKLIPYSLFLFINPIPTYKEPSNKKYNSASLRLCVQLDFESQYQKNGTMLQYPIIFHIFTQKSANRRTELHTCIPHRLIPSTRNTATLRRLIIFHTFTPKSANRRTHLHTCIHRLIG